tara:strand:- start:56 stop:751 length:696 start_codon:yes stop_codon:yes gene_type:complete
MRTALQLLAITGLMTLASAAHCALPPDMDKRTAACTVCHGDQGRATADGYYPRIAGKPAGYLLEQLRSFRDRRRVHDQMASLLAFQTDEYLRDMAEYFAQLKIPYPSPSSSPRDTLSLRRGAILIQQGDGERDIPACIACHGEKLTGLQPAVPGLLGLPYDYLVAQMGAWREGLRRSREPDCMAHIARSLSRQDIDSLAAWLSAQVVPESAMAPEGQINSNLRCGSLDVEP